MSKKSRRKERQAKRRRQRTNFQEVYTNQPEESSINYGKVCVFCGSHDVTRHHVVFQRFAPELAGDSNNIVPMCSRCQKLLHLYTDTLLDYLKTHSRLDKHEIRLPKPISLPPTEREVGKLPPITITGGQVTINF